MSETEMRQEAYRHAADLELECDQIARLVALDDRGESAGWAMIEDLEQRPLDVEKICMIRVTLGTGGPAYGVDFDVDHGLMIRGRAWHQDWFEAKGYADLNYETAEYLWNAWCSHYEEG
jgi:hypothetical protein